MTPQHHQTPEKRPGVTGYVMPLLGFPNEFVDPGSEAMPDAYMARVNPNVILAIWLADGREFIANLHWVHDHVATSWDAVKERSNAEVQLGTDDLIQLVALIHHHAAKMRGNSSYKHRGFM